MTGDLIVLHFKHCENSRSLCVCTCVVCHSAGGAVGPACLGRSAPQFVDYTAPATLKSKAWIELISLGTE